MNINHRRHCWAHRASVVLWHLQAWMPLSWCDCVALTWARRAEQHWHFDRWGSLVLKMWNSSLSGCQIKAHYANHLNAWHCFSLCRSCVSVKVWKKCVCLLSCTRSHVIDICTSSPACYYVGTMWADSSTLGCFHIHLSEGKPLGYRTWKGYPAKLTSEGDWLVDLCIDLHDPSHRQPRWVFLPPLPQEHPILYLRG